MNVIEIKHHKRRCNKGKHDWLHGVKKYGRMCKYCLTYDPQLLLQVENKSSDDFVDYNEFLKMVWSTFDDPTINNIINTGKM